MNRRENDSKKAKNSFAIITVIFALISLFNVADFGAGGLILWMLIIVAVCFAVGIKAKKKSSPKEEKEKGLAFSKGENVKLPFYKREKQSEGPVTSEKRELRAGQIRDAYNEHTLEESLARDRQHRLEQLSVFLKNGIIDKQEYQKLYSRYEKS